ncbi:Golgi apparatus membrane protein TVP23 -like protein B [Halotydeus destructor]|nr:Golgi apparatus membrane protein TVP23 -like protein B [Halotydeus destructor]
MGSTSSNMSSPENIVFDFERDISPQSSQRKFRHPTAALFHISFKLAAFVVYLFGGFIFDEAFLGTFVALILLISMDFWTVKNVTGRLMVGLRWWNFIDEEGNSHWVFENKYAREQQDESKMSKANEPGVNAADSSLFWSALILSPILWFFFLLVSIFRLNVQWFMIVSLAVVLSFSNLYGYFRCKFGSRDIKSAVTQYVGKQIIFNFMSSATGSKPSNPTA